MPAAARAMLALMVLALFIVGGTVAVDEAAEDAANGTSYDSDQQEVADTLNETSKTSFTALRTMIYPAAVVVFLMGLKLLTRL